MTLSEKLENFNTSVIDTATVQSNEIIEEYRKSLEKIFDEHRQDANKKAKNTYRIKYDSIIREKNRNLSHLTLDIRRRVLDRTAEFTDKIFLEIEELLKSYMKTPSYVEYLKSKVKEAYEFARGEDIIIYINPTDECLKYTLQEETGISLTVSNRDFFGGIRAVIPSRTILIDHSFQTKLSEAKSSFKPM